MNKKPGEVTLNKLDPALRNLVAEPDHSHGDVPLPAPVAVNDAGEGLYSVIIRTDNADDLRNAGLRIQSAIGPIVTARLTISGILAAASIESTLSVEADTNLNYPENQQ
jgi:hypothetical protein